MKKPLSMSSYNLLMECPAKYENQKVKGIYPEYEMSYFIFGRALDEGWNSLLLKKEDYQEKCDKVLKELLTKKVQFIPGDYDGELVDDKSSLLKDCKKAGYPGDDVDSLVSSLFDKPELSDKQRKCLALCCYESLKVKADLMLQTYKLKVLPKLKNVTDVQKEYNWSDEKGNSFVAKIDYRADVDDVKNTADNKTSSNVFRDYPEGSVQDSIQFAIYSPQTKDESCFYVVFDKKIKKNREKTCSVCKHDGTGRTHKTCDNNINDKRCNGAWDETIRPEAEFTIRQGKINKDQQVIAQKALTNTAEMIEAGVFPQNLKACKTMYGTKEVRCPYYDFCRNGSMKGLKK